jgi:UDP-glucose:glycoprotein glucosyltransferase
LRKERATVSTLSSLGLSSAQVVDLLTHPSIAEAAGAGSSAIVDGMFDASDRIEGEGTIVYWNNLEKDSRYARWGDTLQTVRHAYSPASLLLNLKGLISIRSSFARCIPDRCTISSSIYITSF